MAPCQLPVPAPAAAAGCQTLARSSFVWLHALGFGSAPAPAGDDDGGLPDFSEE